MENTQEKNNWKLIRTSNGEWISEEYAVFPDKLTAFIYKMKAARHRLKLSEQTDLDGTIWYYKHEFEVVDAITEEKITVEKERKEPLVLRRKLKIEPREPYEPLDF